MPASTSTAAAWLSSPPQRSATELCSSTSDGGAFGVASVPFPVPQLRLGQKVRLNVGGATHFPNGRGKRLRFREGTRVLSPTNLTDALITGASMLTGHFHRRKDAFFDLQIPLDLHTDQSSSPQITVQTLWRPPVVPSPE